MDTPKDICTKYCKQRLQKLVDDKACPFNLTASEIEMVGDDIKVHTVCEGYIESAFKTIIDRISIVTKKGIEIIKEVIKHEKQRQYGDNIGIDNDWFKDVKIGNPNLPQYPGHPWTYTCTVASNTFTGEVEKKNEL